MQGASFFEGTEKKVELVVDDSLPSFRDLGRQYWAHVAARAGARVLSSISNASCDAYLLSESSLFVFDHKVVMMTCGQTTLRDAVREMLRSTPLDKVRMLFYERKSEILPDKQPTSFLEDARDLQRVLPGKVVEFGAGDHRLYLFHAHRDDAVDPADRTLEILMYGVDQAVLRRFTKRGREDSIDVREALGLGRILPGFDIDDHLFDPGGYSLNGICGDEYFTIHVTPEVRSSYVSFETNRRFESNPDETVERVLRTFRPASFELVVFDAKRRPQIEPTGYVLHSRSSRTLDGGYRVGFLHFAGPANGGRVATDRGAIA